MDAASFTAVANGAPRFRTGFRSFSSFAGVGNRICRSPFRWSEIPRSRPGHHRQERRRDASATKTGEDPSIWVSRQAAPRKTESA